MQTIETINKILKSNLRKILCIKYMIIPCSSKKPNKPFILIKKKLKQALVQRGFDAKLGFMICKYKLHIQMINMAVFLVYIFNKLMDSKTQIDILVFFLLDSITILLLLLKKTFLELHVILLPLNNKLFSIDIYLQSLDQEQSYASFISVYEYCWFGFAI